MGTRITALLTVCGIAGAASALMAAPPHVALKEGGGKVSAGSFQDNPFSDNFDSYTAGSGIAGQGTWQLWAPGAPNAFVDNTVASSSPNSLRIDGESDVVQVVNHTSGKWRITGKTYFPTANAFVEGFLIGLNTFPAVANNNWSMQITWRPSTGRVSIQYDDPTNVGVPIVYDQWVEIKVEVDLGTDTYNAWYNNQQFVFNRSWSGGFQPGGAVRLQCWDFYGYQAPGMLGMYWDDIVFEAVSSGCYPNCDLSTTQPILNIDDFTCFINAFAAAQSLPQAQQITHYSNCDGSTIAPVLNIDDFTCFINAFAQGCP